MDFEPTKYAQSDVAYAENEKWFFIHGSHLSSISGWKIYIPYTPEFAESVLQVAIPFLISNKLNFKYIKSTHELIALNSGQYGYSQIGKCLVIYAQEVSEPIIDAIASRLRGIVKAFPRPPYLAKLSSDPPLFYRFGSYVSEQSTSISPDSANIWKERLQTETRQLPVLMKEKHCGKRDENEMNRLLLLYPVVDVISQQGKGGVFVAVDFESEEYKEVIVKLGYRHGGEVQPGVDGIRLIRNDESTLRFLESKPLRLIATPRVIAAAHGKDSYALVQERIIGKNARELLAGGTLTINHINTIISGIKNLHSHQLIWRDAKIDNVVIDPPSGKIGFVDFETSALLSEKCQRNCFKTFQVREDNHLAVDKNGTDLIHFLISILFDPDLDDQKQICLDSLIKRKHVDDVKKYCASALGEYASAKTANPALNSDVPIMPARRLALR